MKKLNLTSGHIFATIITLAIFAVIFSNLIITPANAAITEWHIRDDATGGDCTLLGNWDVATKTCTLSQDLSQGIVIDSNNIILDGNGRTITGSNTGNGVYLSGRIGVTIKNLNIKKFSYGIYLSSSSNNSLTGNTVLDNNTSGIYFLSSNSNTLTGNTASNNYYGGITLDSSNNNTLTGNTASNNYDGIVLYSSNGNTLMNNIAQENLNVDVYVYGWLDSDCNNSVTNTTGSGGRPIKYFSSAVNLSNETLSELILCNADGSSINNITIDGSTMKKNNSLFLIRTDFSTIVNVNSSNNSIGIVLYSSNGNTLAGNTVSNNFNFGITLDYSSDSNTLTGNTANSNSYHGIYLYSSNGNTLTGNTASNNSNYGIVLSSSNNNIITSNAANSNGVGIGIFDSNNQIYKNNFISNSTQAYVLGSGNVFNLASPIGGNYWSNFDELAEGCTNANGDMFCDAPYIFTGGQDNLPWTKKDGWLAPSNNLPILSNLLQWDGTTVISEGYIVRYPSIAFSANVSDPDGDQIQLQVELRRFEEPFTGIDDGGILTSDPVVSGNTTRIARTGLTDGKYHWRARAVDASGNVLEWQEFGSAGNVDFEILTNQPPIASFTFTPQNPKAGDDVFFDASGSYDPDGIVIRYGWDWDGNGIIDIYTDTPFASYLWTFDGAYTVGLYVFDDKNATASTSQTITIEESPTSIYSANICTALLQVFGIKCGNSVTEDERLMDEIDAWIRDQDGDGKPDDGSKPYDWLRGTRCSGAGFRGIQKHCLASVLNKEMREGAEITYKDYIIAVIREQQLVHKALLKGAKIDYSLAVMFDLLPNIPSIFLNDLTSTGVEDIIENILNANGFADTVGLFKFGSSGLSLIFKAISLNAITNKIGDNVYRQAIYDYFYNRNLVADSKDAWEGACVSCRQSPKTELEMYGFSGAILKESRIKFEDWWQKYYVNLQSKYGKIETGEWNWFNGSGLPPKFNQDLKKDIKALILFVVKNK